MPAPNTNAPYDIVNDVLNTARVRLNDAISTLQPVGGKLIQDNEAFTQQAVNNAWRLLQETLSNFGWARLKNETTLLNLPAASSTDPITQVRLNWDNYFPGTGGFNTGFFLPNDLIQVDSLWERVNGAVNTTFFEMSQVFNGLPRTTKGLLNRVWEWRDDALYMPGSTGATDLVIRYSALIGDFFDNGGNPWYMATVPMVHSLNAFADFICAEYCKARDSGAPDAGVFRAMAEEECKWMVERDSNRSLAIYKPSEYSKMRDRFSPVATPKPGPERE